MHTQRAFTGRIQSDVTIVTNFAGLMPLALSDPGWAPLCQAIIFGEITATIGAVVFLPAIYILVTPKNEQDLIN